MSYVAGIVAFVQAWPQIMLAGGGPIIVGGGGGDQKGEDVLKDRLEGSKSVSCIPVDQTALR